MSQQSTTNKSQQRNGRAKTNRMATQATSYTSPVRWTTKSRVTNLTNINALIGRTNHRITKTTTEETQQQSSTRQQSNGTNMDLKRAIKATQAMRASCTKTTTLAMPTTPTTTKTPSRTTTKSALLIYCTLTLITCLLPSPTYAFCPSMCQCLSGGDATSRIYCVDAALDDVPIQLNPETLYINLTRNRIRHVEYTLPFYTKLEILDLSQNILETLGSKNFEYQRELRTLNLSHNLVSSLQKDAFKGLTSLLLLDLSYNRIEVVHPTAMSNLTALLQLDLTNNNIVSLEDNCFRNMYSLEILIFKNNQLLDVPSNNLLHLHELKSLDLSDNLVEYVRNDSFEGLRALMVLTMRGNVISELDLSAFEGLTALKHLDLADNNLTMVPTQQLSKLSNLTYLSLSGNRFPRLPAVAFLNLFHLRELHLNRLDRLNHIDSRAFIDNTHLQALYLNNNPQLYDIPMRLFQGNPNIYEIYMQGNSLQTLYSAQFPVDQLERLYLGDNPLQCNCSLLWLWRLVTGNFDGHTINNVAGSIGVGANGRQTQGEAAVAALGAAASADADLSSAAAAAYVAQQKYNKPALRANNDEPPPLSGYLHLDIERIGCDVWLDNVRIRRRLANMTEGEITCPAHIVTIVCAIFTLLLVFAIGASIVFYLRFVKRRRKLLHDRSLTRSGKSIVNVHDRILQHQPLSGNGGSNTLGGMGMGMTMSMGGGGGGGLTYPHHHTLQQQGGGHHAMMPLHPHDYHQQTLPTQVDKLELERYLAAQTIANEYRALKPWELPPPVKDAANTYSDEPEHLYEKFDHYDYPDVEILTKSTKQATLMADDGSTNSGSGNGVLVMGNGFIGGGGNGSIKGKSGNGGSTTKPHIVYV